MSYHYLSARLMLVSLNFAFLEPHDRQLVLLAAQAEQYFRSDPNTCLIKLRQFGELLAQLIAARVGLYRDPNERQIDLLRRLRDRGVIRGDVDRLFHELRKIGNEATHSFTGSSRTALSGLKYARYLGLWYHRIFGGDRQFDPGPFVPPLNPDQETESLKIELEQLRQEFAAAQSEAEIAQAALIQEAQQRQSAEALAREAEAKAQEVSDHLAQLQAEATAQSAQTIQQVVTQAQIVESSLTLDERETRRLIDTQLQLAGWEVDSEVLTYRNGTRPQKGKNLAIAEYPTRNGIADYALFAGLQAIAVVEAKRQSTDVAGGALNQAKRYSAGFEVRENVVLPARSPWGDYQIPFVFATNGREYLRQIETKSGIWFCDLRRPTNRRVTLQSWHKPQGLIEMLAQDIDAANQRLAQENFNYGVELRPYQQKAIQAIESALAEDCRELLLAMATGTGKTKTAIALCYRLLKTKRFRRILFLVDRKALGEQAGNAFKDTRMENLQTFADIFEIKELKDTEADPETKVHIATVQSFVKRILYATDEKNVPTADQYDCIIVDECHRGYLLDRELSEDELEFRDFEDYISKYRRVLDQFDAVKIGLTATPALQTTQIFGEPVFQYSYRDAVIDGWLIDHEPRIQIQTELSQTGIVWNPGDQVEFFNPKTGELDLVHAPDEMRFEVEQFNRRVITQEFNRVVCEAIAPYLDPSLPEKTLIFCATDAHADIVVEKLKDALENLYGSIEDEAIAKITGKADQPLQLIRRFKNEANPKIAVTVDLLTTGIDVPAICNLVFIRRINSRILYEQMLGRATRRCDEIGKTIFRVFDAVGLYEAIAPVTTMKPIVVDPNIPFTQLIEELGTVTKPSAIDGILDQLLAKLQRQRRHLSETRQQQIEAITEMPIAQIPAHLQTLDRSQAVQWLRERAAIAQMLDRRDSGTRPLLISHHADRLVSMEQDFGDAARPEDYLDEFRAFLQENLNQIPALLIVTQRPRDLTRSQLKELRLALDAAGYSETNLRTAWRNAKNEEIAASIVGFIRQAALGDALIPYEERVDRAMRRILASRSWTPPQRRWLERIGKQLKLEVVVDRESFEQGAFKTDGGGFDRLNRVFEGRLEEILVEVGDRIWEEVG